MKIGKFAETHNITQDTIRHYLDLGLLVAEKQGSQFHFNESDSNDIRQIIELKKLNFALNEIQNILTIQRISGTNTDSFRGLYLTILEDKKKEVDKEILKYNEVNKLINDEICEIKIEKFKDKQKLGFPLNSLHLLVCPKCQKHLVLSDGTIESNNVIDANINCKCGYKAIIRKGIYIYESSVKTKLLNGKIMPTKEEYLAKSSHTYNNFLYKGMTNLVEYIKRYSNEPEYIMEIDNCVGFFLLQYINYLPSDSVYILIDYDIERIKQLKMDLETHYEHKNFIFLCCDYKNIPIKKTSLDILIDYQMSKHYEEEYGESMFDNMHQLLKQNGIITASYLYSGENNTNSKIIESLDNNCFKILESSDIGPVKDNNYYNFEFNNMGLYQRTLVSKKS